MNYWPQHCILAYVLHAPLATTEAVLILKVDVTSRFLLRLCLLSHTGKLLLCLLELLA